MRRNFQYGIFLLFLISGLKLEAQTLRGIQENAVIKKALQQKKYALKSAHQVTALTLPFFEDFSNLSVFPDPMKWTDHFAFINNSFASDPVSIGVATLDAIDAEGEVYAVNNLPILSDHLTSQPFDLSIYTSADVVRFSFFYQAGGKGETPELVDSLLLDFYDPVNVRWNRIWYVQRDTFTPFQQVVLEIPESYYVNGFRFRFRNYTSMSPNDVSGGEGALSNVDCWNIDYIMMNTAPLASHTRIDDITLTDIPRNLLDFYEVIPWRHLNNAQSITRNLMNFDIRCLMIPGDEVNVGRSYYLKNLLSGYLETYEEFFEILKTDTLVRRYDPFFAPFTGNTSTQQGLLEAGNYIITPGSQYKGNDTATTILNFKDAYAYDDGTAEFGFGIEGPSTGGAFTAMRFRIFKTDTLRALDLFFNKTRGDYTSNLPFKICVWEDGGNKPGELIYISPENLYPLFGASNNSFIRYPITDEKILITDTVIYVGWQQGTESFLNFGFDVNRNNNQRTFFNISGEWANAEGSLLPGTIMVRAVFGGPEVITSIPKNPDHSSDLKIYPNPASESIRIQSTEPIHDIKIYDITGRLILHKEGNTEFLDVSLLASGIYTVIIEDSQNIPLSYKIIIN